MSKRGFEYGVVVVMIAVESLRYDALVGIRVIILRAK